MVDKLKDSINQTNLKVEQQKEIPEKSSCDTVEKKDSWIDHDAIINAANGKMPDGRDCLSCKIIATITPLALCAYTIQNYRKQNFKAMHKNNYRYMTKISYGFVAASCLWMSFLSATGGWLAPREEEGLQEFFERDRKNQKELRGKIWTYIKTFTESK